MPNGTQAPATAEGPTQHTQNQSDRPAGTYGYTREQQILALHKLREPFVQSEVRYRPQPYCKKCSNATGWPKVCERHTEIKCHRCNGQKITEAHICLKYIGHAEATNRLLNADPFWDWEPLSYDERGLPQFDNVPGLWIRLTVCGMTRIGYGDATGKAGANAIKEIIGDAIRNAGMRFGMALNLWTSSDLEIIEPGVELTPELAAELGTSPGPAPQPTPAPAKGPEATPPAQPQRQSRSAPAQQSETASDRPAMTPEQSQAMALEEFKPKVLNGWNNAGATQQNLLEATAKSLLNEVIPAGPDKIPTRIEDLLKNRLAELKAARQERNAA
ncbi:hypothetical protein ACFYXD_34920 [Streptomyces platensis]|uniref:hypothetical protein n=1 Tax=Streptomyces platensis TaxID=58346 RepID=UPI0036965606